MSIGRSTDPSILLRNLGLRYGQKYLGSTQYTGLYNATVVDTDATNPSIAKGNLRVLIPDLDPSEPWEPIPYPGTTPPPNKTTCTIGFGANGSPFVVAFPGWQATGGGVETPSITSLSATTGTTLGGDTITITGLNLSSTTGVDFGSTPASILSITATTVVVTTPPEAAGSAPVTVITLIGTTAPSPFTYVAPAPPVITGFSPSSGTTSGGTALVITGTGLASVTQVQLNGQLAPISVQSSTSITVTTPANAAGYVPVEVFSPLGNVTATTQYQYTASAPPPPVVTSWGPTSGPTAGGQTWTITGTNLGAASYVDFGSTSVTSFVSNTATQIVLLTPPGAAGMVTVSLATAGGTATDGTQYTYFAGTAVSSYTPTTGFTNALTPVVITGSGFTGATGVTFGGVAGTSFSVVNDTTIDVTSPKGNVGSVNVIVQGATNNATAPVQFAYVAPAPTISSFAPTSGTTAGGVANQVTITGTNLSAASQVLFGTAAGTITSDPGTVQSEGTTIIVNPPAASAGLVNVKVTTPGGNATASTQYQYTGGTSAPAKIMVIPLENQGQQLFYAGTSSCEMATLMNQYTYAGSLALGHYSGSNYVLMYSGIDCHSIDYPPTPNGGGTANPDYNSAIINDITSPNLTFNARTTIWDLVYQAGKTGMVYYDHGGIGTGSGNVSVHRDPISYFARLTTAAEGFYSSGSTYSGTLMTTRTASGSGATALAGLIGAAGTGNLDTDNPDFVWVQPNDTNNGHGDSDGSFTASNAFLNSFIPAVQATNWYKNGGTIILWWDEDDFYSTGESVTATWVPLGQGSDTRDGGSGGFTWVASISEQTAVGGGNDLTGGTTFHLTNPYSGEDSVKTGTTTFEAGFSSAGLFAMICNALGISQTTLAGLTRCTGSYAQMLSGFIVAPGGGGGPPPGGPPAMPTTSQTVNVDGTNVTFNPVWSDSFPGTTLNSTNWYQFQSTSPGAGETSPWDAQWPGNLAYVNQGGLQGLTFMAQVDPSSSTTLFTGGVGANQALYQTPPAMVDWAMKILVNSTSADLTTYCLWWPNVGSWPPNQEYDIYENNGTGTVTHLTVHGSPSGSTANNQTQSAEITQNFNQWTYCRAVWTVNSIQFWAGADVNHLSLMAERTAAQISSANIVSPGGTTIDQTGHAWDMALLLEGGTPTGFTTTPTAVTQIAWVVGFN